MFLVFFCAGGAQADSQEPVRLIAAGDVLPHLNVLRAARENGTRENFFFGALLSNSLRERVRSADLAFTNLETPVATKDYNVRKPFIFNAPFDLVQALGWLGFDVLSVANNHSYDQSRKGVQETFQAIERAGLKSVGSGTSRQQALRGEVFEIRGIKVGFLAFAEMFNSEPRRDRPEKTWVARLKDRKLALKAVRAMRERANVVVVSVHWGKEYETVANADQRRWARALSDAGADLILGHHPHVLQSVEWLDSKTRGKKTLVAYSLGNLISNQQARYRLGQKPLALGDTRDGLLLEVELTRDGVRGFESIPTWTHHARGKKLTIVVRDLRQEIALLESKRRKPSSERTQLKNLRERLSRIELILTRPQVSPKKSR